MSDSTEPERPGQRFEGPVEIRRFEPQSAPKPDEANPKMPGAVPTNRHKPIPNDFEAGFGVVRPRSKPFNLRDISAEPD